MVQSASSPEPQGIPAHILDSPDLHRHILSSVSDGIHVIDMQGRVIIENDASVRMLGWCDDCLVGKLGHAAIHHHHADGSAFPLQDCPIFATVQDGVPREVSEDVFWRQDGSSFPVEYRTAPLCDAGGNRYGVTVVFRDITERKRAALLQATLHAISECAHDCESPAALYPQVHRIISAILPAGHLHVTLREGDAGGLSFPYWADDQVPAPPVVPWAETPLTSQVMSAGQPILATTIEGSETLDPTPGPCNWLGVPLHAEHQLIGALVVQTRAGQRHYTPADRELLQFVSTQLATSIERTQRDAQLRHMAQFDALTDLPNRTLFYDRLDAALSQARRRGEHLALLFIDLDKFKPVNDDFGHAVGDALLVAVAGCIRRLLRASDTVGRVGGDEFVVVLHPMAAAADAAAVAEKIRAALDQPFELAGQRLQISASIGVAVYPADGADGDALARAADEAMYRAKRQGSNRVVLVGAEPEA
ncbi:diguanylate cyclase domain-containing protein [Ideonella sp.]|uniref:diguanylate cyclase domain-containing protein n=1 Tax=Ideonella sp. TaxID=1929293 RepID=UPI0035AF4B74